MGISGRADGYATPTRTRTLTTARNAAALSGGGRSSHTAAAAGTQAFASLGEPVSDEFMLRATQHVTKHLHAYTARMLVSTLWATGTLRHKFQYDNSSSGWAEGRKCVRLPSFFSGEISAGLLACKCVWCCLFSCMAVAVWTLRTQPRPLNVIGGGRLRVCAGRFRGGSTARPRRCATASRR